MASSPSHSSSPNPVGHWFCQISSGLQGRWQGGRAEPQQGAKISGAGAGTEARQARAADAAGGKDDEPTRKAAATTSTCRRDAMPEATVYLLLDRFAPS